MTDTTDGETPIAGVILPEPRKGRPYLALVRHGPGRYRDPALGPGARPCEHGPFTLDEKWRTVTCDKCGCQVDAFAVLANIAAVREDYDRSRINAEHAERRLQVAELRRLARLRSVTEGERAELQAAIGRHYMATPAELREVAARIDRAVRDRRQAYGKRRASQR